LCCLVQLADTDEGHRQSSAPARYARIVRYLLANQVEDFGQAPLCGAGKPDLRGEPDERVGLSGVLPDLQCGESRPLDLVSATRDHHATTAVRGLEPPKHRVVHLGSYSPQAREQTVAQVKITNLHAVDESSGANEDDLLRVTDPL